MNARPNAWLRQAENDLALAQLARDNGFLAQACFYSSQAAEKGLKVPSWNWERSHPTPMC